MEEVDLVDLLSCLPPPHGEGFLLGFTLGFLGLFLFLLGLSFLSLFLLLFALALLQITQCCRLGGMLVLDFALALLHTQNHSVEMLPV